MATLESLVNCPVCLEVFRTPKLLHCGHTLCLECVRNITTSSGTSHVSCPICRENTPMPLGQVEALADDFRMGQILETLQNKCITDSVDEICKVCGKNATHSLCLQCSMYMCHVCLGKHRLKQDAVLHTILKVEDIEMCCIHETPCSQICSDCRRFICIRCTLDSCLGHNSRDIGQAIRDHVGQSSPSIEISARFFKHIQEQQSELFAAAKKALVDHTDMLIGRLLSRREELEKELEGLKADALRTVDTEEDKHVSNLSLFFSVDAATLEAGIPSSLVKLLSHVETLPEGSWADVKFVPSNDLKVDSLGTFVLGDLDVREGMHINELHQKYGPQVKLHDEVESISPCRPLTYHEFVTDGKSAACAVKDKSSESHRTSVDPKENLFDCILPKVDFAGPAPDSPVAFTIGTGTGTGVNPVHAHLKKKFKRKDHKNELISKPVSAPEVMANFPQMKGSLDLVDIEAVFGKNKSVTSVFRAEPIVKSTENGCQGSSTAPTPTNSQTTMGKPSLIFAETTVKQTRFDREPAEAMSSVCHGMVQTSNPAKTLISAPVKVHKLRVTWQQHGEGHLNLFAYKRKPWAVVMVSGENLPIGYMSHIVREDMHVIKQGSASDARVIWQVGMLGWEKRHLERLSVSFASDDIADEFVLRFAEAKQYSQRKKQEALSKRVRKVPAENLDGCNYFRSTTDQMKKVSDGEKANVDKKDVILDNIWWGKAGEFSGFRFSSPQPQVDNSVKMILLREPGGVETFKGDVQSGRFQGKLSAVSLDGEDKNLEEVASCVGKDEKKLDVDRLAGRSSDSDTDLYEGDSSISPPGLDKNQSQPESSSPDLPQLKFAVSSHSESSSDISDLPDANLPQPLAKHCMITTGCDVNSVSSLPAFPLSCPMETAQTNSLPDDMMPGYRPVVSVPPSLAMTIMTHPALIDDSAGSSDQSENSGENSNEVDVTESTTADSSKLPQSNGSSGSVDVDDATSLPFYSLPTFSPAATEIHDGDANTSSASNAEAFLLAQPGVTTSVISSVGDSFPSVSPANQGDSGDQTIAPPSSSPSGHQESKLSPLKWECQQCWALNDRTTASCEVCQSPKSNGAPPRNGILMSHSFDSSGGCWECRFCWTRNKDDTDACLVCKTPRSFEGISRNGPAKFSLPIENN